MYSPLFNNMIGQVAQPLGSSVGQLASGFATIGNIGMMFASPGSGPSLGSIAGGSYLSGLGSSLNLGALGSLIGGISSGAAGAPVGQGSSGGGQKTLGAYGQLVGANSGNSGSGTGSSGGSGILGGLVGNIGLDMGSLVLLLIGVGALAFAFFGRND